MAAVRKLETKDNDYDLYVVKVPKRKKKTIPSWVWKQKVISLILVLLGIIVPFVNNMDATASILLVPFGIYLFFVKEKVVD